MNRLRLTPHVAPLPVSSSITTDELLRALEHSYPNPPPLLAMAFAQLNYYTNTAARRPERLDATGHLFQPPLPANAVQCPSCGCRLHATLEP